MLYYFDLHDPWGVTRDTEGQRCSSLADAVRHAIESLRSVASADVREGSFCTDCHIDLRTPAGPIRQVWLREAIDIR